MPQDPVSDWLKTQSLPDTAKAQAWDAYYHASDHDDFVTRLKGVQGLADPQRARLWNMKYAPQNIPSPSQPTQESPSWFSDERLGKGIGALSTAWTAANTPVADFGGHQGRTQDWVTRFLTGGAGTAEAEKRIADIPNRTLTGSPAEVGARTFLESSLAGKDASVAKSATDMALTPLGITTFAVGGLLSRLGVMEEEALARSGKSLDQLLHLRQSGATADSIETALQDHQAARAYAEKVALYHRSARTVEMGAGAGFGGAGGEQAYEASQRYRDATTAQEQEQAKAEMASGASQVLFGVHGMSQASHGGADLSEHLTRSDQAIRDTQMQLAQANRAKIQTPEMAIQAPEMSPIPSPTPVTKPVKEIITSRPQSKNVFQQPEPVVPSRVSDVIAPRPKAPEAPLQVESEPTPLAEAPKPPVSVRPVLAGNEDPLLAKIKEAYPDADPERLKSLYDKAMELRSDRQAKEQTATPQPAHQNGSDVAKPELARTSLSPAGERGWKQYQFHTDQNEQLERRFTYDPSGKQVGNEEDLRVYKANQEAAIEGFRNWAQYADRDQVIDTVSNIRRKLESDADRLDLMRVLSVGLANEKLAFHKGIEGSEYLSEESLQKAIGRRTVPTVPADYVVGDPLRQETVEKGLGLKPQLDELDSRIKEVQGRKEDASELLQRRRELNKTYLNAKALQRRQWAADYIKSRAQGLRAQVEHNANLARAAINAKSLRPTDFIEDVKDKVVVRPALESTAGGEAPVYTKESITGQIFTSELDARKAATQAFGQDNYTLLSKDTGGKVQYRAIPKEQIARATFKATSEDVAARQQNLAYLKSELTKATSEKARIKLQRAIVKEERALSQSNQVGQQAEASTSAQAPPDARQQAAAAAASTGESVSSPKSAKVNKLSPEEADALAEAEVQRVNAARQAAAKSESVNNEIFESRVQQLVKKGMARGTAEKMVLSKLESERGSLSFRPRQPQPRLYGPQGPSVTWRIGDAIERALDRNTAEENRAMDIIREAGGELARKHQMVWNKLQESIDAHDKDGEPELRRFMDAGEMKPGATVLSPEDQAVAQELHNMFQDRWARLQKLIPERFDGAGIDHYLKHLWKNPKAAGQSLSPWSELFAKYIGGKRPLEGPSGFTKHRFYSYLSDGLDKGLKPVTYNPIKMQLLGLFEIDRFIMAHDIKNDYRGAGLVKFVKLGKEVPQGWQKLDDKIFKPREFKDGALITHGEYWAPPEVAKRFNDYLAPGLRNESTAYNIARQYGNMMNQIQLGFSAFHAGFEVLNASSSDVALGLQKIFSKDTDVAGGLKNIGRGMFPLASATHYYSLGKAIEREYIAPTGVNANNVKLAIAARAMEVAGGRIGLDPIYSNQAYDAMRNAIANKQYHAVGWHAVSHAAEYVSRPIMKYFVPRIKLGMFADMAEHRMDQLVKDNAPRETIAHELGKVWDSVDNRAGQLVYDNLFWKKKTKDLGFLAVRSLGWNLGTGRELGGAGVDVARNVSSIMKGDFKNVRMTERMAYAVGMTAVVGTIGATMNYLATGKAPQKPEDYFFPKTGTIDPSGNEARRSLPSYVRDVAAVWNQPLKTIINKAQPMLVDAYELYTNQDYYGNEIRHPGDSFLARAWQVGKHEVKNLEPFGIQSYLRSRDSAESPADAALSFVGVTPAPRYIGQTDAEKLAFIYSEKYREVGPRDSATWDKYQTAGKLRAQYAAHKIDIDRLEDALLAGKITDRQFNDMLGAADVSPFERQIKAVREPRDLMTIWQHANATERVMMQDRMLTLWDKVDPAQDPDLFQRYQKELGY